MNPFKRFGGKKITLDDAEGVSKDIPEQRPAADKPAAPDKVSGLFRATRQRRVKIKALEQRYEQIRRLADPVERLLEHKKLQDRCSDLLVAIKDGISPSFGTGMGGVALMAAGIGTANPALFVGGFTAMMGGMVTAGSSSKRWNISPALRHDRKDIRALMEKNTVAIDTLVTSADLQDVAQSSYYETAAGLFPALKERFQAAAANDKVLQNLRKHAPKLDKPWPQF